MSLATIMHCDCDSISSLPLLYIILIVLKYEKAYSHFGIIFYILSPILTVKEQKSRKYMQISRLQDCATADLLNICIMFGDWHAKKR